MAFAAGSTLKRVPTTTAAAAASTLFNKFLRLRPPFTATSILTNRSLCSKSSTTTTSEWARRTGEKTRNDQESPTSKWARRTGEKTRNDQESPFIIKGSPQKFKMENPFQSGGPKDVVAVDECRDGILVRVTLPGIAPDGCRVWAENNTVFFAGRGEIEHESETSGRTYGGSLEFDAEYSKVEEVKSEMKNGILRMMIPTVGGLGSDSEGKDQKK